MSGSPIQKARPMPRRQERGTAYHEAPGPISAPACIERGRKRHIGEQTGAAEEVDFGERFSMQDYVGRPQATPY